MLWDLKNGERLQELRRAGSQLPYLAFEGMRHNNASFISGIADGHLELYRWHSAGNVH
jgi:hypothetical protein